MKIAITSHGDNPYAAIDARFGRAAYFMFYDQESGIWDCVPNRQSLEAPHGAGIQAAQSVINGGASVLITNNVGPKAFKVLNAEHIKIYAAGNTGCTVEEGLQAFLQETLPVLNAPNALDMKK